MDTMKSRAGFTLVEVLVALVMTAVIGAAVTGVFISQSRFFDTQEKVASARGVSQSAMNFIISELRMVEQAGGVLSATNRQITIRAPYALGLVCDTVGSKVTISRLPADPIAYVEAGYSGYAHLLANGTYRYVETGQAPAPVSSSLCTSKGITVFTDAGGTSDGEVVQFNHSQSLRPLIGTPVLLFQLVTYEFKASTSTAGRVALWRRTHIGPNPHPLDEELLAPFDTTAKFRFYHGDNPVPQTTVPPVSSITGVELVLDGLSLRPGKNGSRQRAPLKTSVFFQNRL